MSRTTHNARIVGPVVYSAEKGVKARIPLGPCLLECIDDESVDIIWQLDGLRSVELPMKALLTATIRGTIQLRD